MFYAAISHQVMCVGGRFQHSWQRFDHVFGVLSNQHQVKPGFSQLEIQIVNKESSTYVEELSFLHYEYHQVLVLLCFLCSY